jgi:hypothetical protein
MDGLDRGRIERDHHHLDAVCVHLAKSPIRNVEQPGVQNGPVPLRHEHRRVSKRLGYREMFF